VLKTLRPSAIQFLNHDNRWSWFYWESLSDLACREEWNFYDKQSVSISRQKCSVHYIISAWLSSKCEKIYHYYGLSLLGYCVIEVLYAHSRKLFLFLFFFLLRTSFDRFSSNWIYTYFFEVRHKYLLELLYTSKIIVKRVSGKHTFLLLWSSYTTSSVLILDHKADQADYDCRHGPTWIPKFRVVITKVSADLFTRLKSTVWSQHNYTWRFKRVVSWETQSTMVKSIFIWAVLQTIN